MDASKLWEASVIRKKIIVDMSFLKSHLNYIITIIDLGAIKFEDFSSDTFH